MAPGSGPVVVKDAHYHAIKATETWAAFAAAMRAIATEPAGERLRRDEERQDATTYARGTLGGH